MIPRRLGRRASAIGLGVVALLIMIDDPSGATPAASSIRTLDIWAPSVARDARDGWPMRATRQHRADVSRSVARGIRAAGCRVGRVRARSLRGAAVWAVRTDARKGSPRGNAGCGSYRMVRVRVREDGSGLGWPTPPPRPVPMTTPKGR